MSISLKEKDRIAIIQNKTNLILTLKNDILFITLLDSNTIIKVIIKDEINLEKLPILINSNNIHNINVEFPKKYKSIVLPPRK